MSVHTGLIDNVNDALTEWQHTYAEGVLRGWRAGLEHCGRAWSPSEADFHTMERFGERPMCCGVLLDWSPPDTLCERITGPNGEACGLVRPCPDCGPGCHDVPEGA
jgi:hypothetical protein